MSDPQAQLSAYYSSAADDYAELWEPILHPMGEVLVRSMSLATARSVLDVGSGTGSLLPLLRARAPRALVIGVDRSEGMLRIGSRKHPECFPAVMDAQGLGLHAAAVDAVVFAFVLFHCPEPTRALQEARRVLRPDGVAGVTTWGRDELPGTDIWTEELDAHGAAQDSLSAVVRRFELMDDEPKVERLLSEAGLLPARTWTRQFERRWSTEELVVVRARCGVPGRRLRSLAPDARERCIQSVRRRLNGLTPSDLLQQMEVIFALAHRAPERLRA